MKSISLILSLSVFLFSCVHNSNNDLLTRASDLLNSHPDSSLAVLKRIDSSTLEDNEQKARYALYLSAALDKNMVDVTSDSLISIATDYYSSRGDSRERMLAWYYYGIIQKNMQSYSKAVVSLEKAAKIAKEMNESRQLGLIYRNIASSFASSNNIHSAISYYQRAISSFEINPADSLYYQYAKCSLAISYYINGEYDKAWSTLSEIDNTTNASLLISINSLKAKLEILGNDNYEHGLALFRLIPKRSFGFQDCSVIALAYSYLSKPDSSDIWLQYAYSIANNEADTATVDYKKAMILLNRGRVNEAFNLLKHSTLVQDSLTRALLRESVSIAQRDFFREEAEKEKERLEETRRRSIITGMIGFLIALLVISLLVLRSWKKDQWLKELMAKEAINSQSISQLSKGNASLLSTHYSERIRNLDIISREYYTSDNKTQRDLVFKQFKEYVGNLRDDSTFYKSIEDDLDLYCDNLMKKLREEVPQIKGNSLRSIILFFAGFSYETVSIITHAQSISSLKMQRSRLRRVIEESTAEDKKLFLEMLEMKRPQARKTND